MKRASCSYWPFLASLMMLMPTVTAGAAGNCEALLAADHIKVFAGLRVQLETVTGADDLRKWALPTLERVTASSALGLSCYHDTRKS